MVCPPFGGVRNGIARTAIEGIVDTPYEIPNVLVDYHAADPGIPGELLALGGLFAEYVLRRELHR